MKRRTLAVAMVAALGLFTGCQSAGATQEQGNSKQSGEVSLLPEVAPLPKAKVSITPSGGAEQVGVDDPIRVTASGGTLDSVSVKDSNGDEVGGEFDQKQQTWTANQSQLRPDRTYHVQAVAKNADDEVTETGQDFQTAPPSTVVGTDIYPLDGQTVGVGMPLVVIFDHAVQNRAEVQKQLEVETSRPVEGAWHWFSDTEVHYRPKEYWPAHTDVTLRLNFKDFRYGKDAWGIRNKTKHFTIGQSVVTKVDLSGSHNANVYVDGDLARTIPVSGGKPGWETRDGTKLILDKERNKKFTDEMVGDDEENYDLKAAYALRVTWSGEFLHTATWSVASQGHENTSHGCVGMSTSDSRWLYGISKAGDPVETISGGEPMDVTGNGYGDWNMSWSEWKAGSAS